MPMLAVVSLFIFCNVDIKEEPKVGLCIIFRLVSMYFRNCSLWSNAVITNSNPPRLLRDDFVALKSKMDTGLHNKRS